MIEMFVCDEDPVYFVNMKCVEEAPNVWRGIHQKLVAGQREEYRGATSQMSALLFPCPCTRPALTTNGRNALGATRP